ncbi:MAG: hypothetical protein [Caudoviricetes sp.]|nr:MAG: hypothetical protein [Caudoviricetes sp.]
MYVRPSKICKTRYWWCKVSWMEGQKFKVKGADGDYISFWDGSINRRWHKSNLEIIRSIQLENK